MWGFSIEAELVENKDKQDELCCFVSRVEERSVASGNGKALYYFKPLVTCDHRSFAINVAVQEFTF